MAHTYPELWERRIAARDESLLQRYPNIRVFDSDAVAILANGTVRHFSDLDGVMPVMIVNRDEATLKHHAERVKDGFFRAYYSNPAHFENSVAYEINSLGITQPDAIGRYRRNHFFQIYPSAKPGEWEGYCKAAPDQRRKLLGEMYDRDLRYLNDLSGTYRLAREAMQAIAKKNPDIIERSAERQEKLIQAMEQVPAELLSIVNQVGGIVVTASKGKHISNTEAEGYVTGANGVIGFKESLLSQPRYVCEEFVHRVDTVLGFTLKPKWIKAAEADSARPLAKAFLSFTNGEPDSKAELADRFSYKEVDVPLELLPDLYDVDRNFGDWMKKLRTDAKKFDTTDGPNRALDGLVRLADKHGNDKDKIMGALFPQSWPLFKEFKQQVRHRATHGIPDIGGARHTIDTAADRIVARRSATDKGQSSVVT